MKIKLKESKNEVWDILFISDSHFRHDKPLCYTEDVDFWNDVQLPTIRFVADLVQKHNVEVVHSGDLFDRAKPPYNLLSQCCDRLSSWNDYVDEQTYLHKNNFFCIAGNHDLPYHNYDDRNESAWGILKISEVFNDYYEGQQGRIHLVDYGNEDKMNTALSFASHKKLKPQILVTHQFIWDGKVLPFPGCEYPTALDYMDQYPEFDLIVTGDNHQSFMVENERGQRLLNPGCMIRQNVKEIDYKPKGYLLNIASMEIKAIDLPFVYEHISKDYKLREHENEDRKTAFVSSLQRDMEVGLSFQSNLESLIHTTKPSKSVQDIIYRALEK